MLAMSFTYPGLFNLYAFCTNILVMVPTQPDFYHLGSLPNSLSSLSLAFEINHTPIEIPSGQKLFHSGSKWFPEAVLPALPQRLKGKLRELWLASVRLSTEDLNVMRQYTKLNTLTCRSILLLIYSL